jgi:hypothetical protein
MKDKVAVATGRRCHHQAPVEGFEASLQVRQVPEDVTLRQGGCLGEGAHGAGFRRERPFQTLPVALQAIG